MSDDVVQKMQEQLVRLQSARDAEVQYLDLRMQAMHREANHLHHDNDLLKQKIAELETANEVLLSTIRNLRQQVRDIEVNRAVPLRGGA